MSEIEDLKKEIAEIKASLKPQYAKVSSMQVSGELKEVLDTYRECGKKESFEDLIWKLTKNINFSDSELNAICMLIYSHKHGGTPKISADDEEYLDKVLEKIGIEAKSKLHDMLNR
jgi:hypothetical protein